MGPILLEGPDGAGKTTLAKFLADKYGLRSIKNGAPAPGEDLAQTYLSQIAPNVVIDRSWPSEFIYAPLMKRRPQVSVYQFTALFDTLERRGGRMIICLPLLSVCEAAWRDRPGELFKDPDILKAVWDGYVNLAKFFRTCRFVHNYDWQADTDDNAKLVEWLEER